MFSTGKKILLLFLIFMFVQPSPCSGSSQLEKDIYSLLKSQKYNLSKVGVCVVSENGKMITAINSSTPLEPASNLKILTTAAGLFLLGTGYTFETFLTTCSPIKNGFINNDVFISGTGDPNISGRFYNDKPLTLFQSWAHKLHLMGLKTINGDLVVDDTFFDAERFNSTWDPSQEGRWYCAQVSPLSLNDNCVDIEIYPSKPGKPAKVKVTPSSSFVSVKGAPITITKGKTRIIIRRKTQTNNITIKGTINRKRKYWKDYITVHDPAMFFAYTLSDVLKTEGITVKGKIRRVKENDSETSSQPSSTTAGWKKKKLQHHVLLIHHTSTLLRDIPVINKNSQNLHAEILLKTLGAECSNSGSVAGGAFAIKMFLRKTKIPCENIVIADGSGLSHSNRLTTNLLAHTLYAVTKENFYNLFMNSLPIAGKDGTLKKHHRFRSFPGLLGKVYAKTGSISGVSCLSGYVVRDEKTRCFSIFLNHLPGGQALAQRLEDNIVARIYSSMKQDKGSPLKLKKMVHSSNRYNH